MKKWYSFSAAEKPEGAASSADVYIFDYIGGLEVSAREFISEIKGLDVERINLHINSPGGSIVDGVAIQNSLKHHKAKVSVFIDGLAASIASIVALGGDEITIADNAYVMIHNPTSIVLGEAKDMLKEAEVLNKMTDGLAADYARRMGIATDEARALMEEETWWLGQEAVDAGFADAVFSGSQATASFALDRITRKAPQAVLTRFTGRKTTIEEEIMKNKTTNKNSSMPEKQDAAVPAEGEALDSKQPAAGEGAGGAVAAEGIIEGQPAEDRVEAAVAAALQKDRRRQARIREIGGRFGFSAAAEKFAQDGKSVEEFQDHILGKSPDDWKASLAIRNPCSQPEEQELQDEKEGTDAVAKIKERRKNQYGG